MALGGGEAGDQRVDVPHAVLHRRRGQHQHVAERALLQRLEHRARELRRLVAAGQVAQLVGFVEHHHVEAGAGDVAHAVARRLVGRDHHRRGRAQVVGEVLPGAGGDAGHAELARQLLGPLLDQHRRAQHERAADLLAHLQLVEDQAGRDRLAQAHVVGDQRHRRAPAERDQVAHLVLVRLDLLLPVLGRQDVGARLDQDRRRHAVLDRREVQLEVLVARRRRQCCELQGVRRPVHGVGGGDRPNCFNPPTCSR